MKGGIAEFSERPIASIPFRPIDWSNPDESESHDEIVALVQSSLTGSDLATVLREIRQIFTSDLGLPT